MLLDGKTRRIQNAYAGRRMKEAAAAVTFALGFDDE